MTLKGHLQKIPKGKGPNMCQALRSNGYPCGNIMHIEAVWRDQPIRLCGHHKEWRPDRHKGKSSHLPKLSAREKKIRQEYRNRNAERCCFPNKQGGVCQSAPCHRDEAGRPWCYYHKTQWGLATPEKQAMMEQRILEFQMAKAVGDKVDDKAFLETGKRPIVKDMPTEVEQVQKLEELAAADTEMKTLKATPQGTHFIQKVPRGKTMGKSQFMGIDIEHYTPDFKYDYLFLLFKQIRRAEAMVNILAETLYKIEVEEDQLKQTETKGTMFNDKGEPIEFHNTTTRHVTPVETKLNLVDKLTKQEEHLSKLLKQLEQLPMTCLAVFRKMGVRWDRQAAMMVVENIEDDKIKDMEGYTDVDVQKLPSQIDEVQRMVKKAGLEAVNPAAKTVKNFEKW